MERRIDGAFDGGCGRCTGWRLGSARAGRSDLQDHERRPSGDPEGHRRPEGVDRLGHAGAGADHDRSPQRAAAHRHADLAAARRAGHRGRGLPRRRRPAARAGTSTWWTTRTSRSAGRARRVRGCGLGWPRPRSARRLWPLVIADHANYAAYQTKTARRDPAGAPGAAGPRRPERNVLPGRRVAPPATVIEADRGPDHRHPGSTAGCGRTGCVDPGLRRTCAPRPGAGSRRRRCVEPGRERPGQPARPEQPGVPAGDQLAERDPADEPAVHLRGVGLDGEVDVVALVVLADGDRAASMLEPALGAAGAGQDQVHDGALPRAAWPGSRAGAGARSATGRRSPRSVGSPNIHSAAQWPIAQTIGVSASPAGVRS